MSCPVCEAKPSFYSLPEQIQFVFLVACFIEDLHYDSVLVQFMSLEDINNDFHQTKGMF